MLVVVVALMIVAVVALWWSTRKPPGDQWFDTLAAPEHPLAGPNAHFYPQASGNVQRPGAGSQDTYAAPLSLEEELEQSVGASGVLPALDQSVPCSARFLRHEPNRRNRRDL